MQERGLTLKGDFAAIDKDKEHCEAGEANLGGYPFLTSVSGVIAQHHENYDGSGPHRLSGEAIPAACQGSYASADVVRLSAFDLENALYQDKIAILDFASSRSGSTFDPIARGGLRKASP